MIRRTLISMVLSAVPIAGLGAQGVIVTGTSSSQFVDLRPLVRDSVPYGTTDSVSSLLRRTAAGALSNCAAVDPFCYFYTSAPRTGLVAMMQDLTLSAWGLGQGLSFHAQVRARTAAGPGRALWPQADQAFDALSAYAQLSRDRFDLRAGRQWIASGLGVYNFDGGALDARPLEHLDVNVYGGRSLVQGLDRPLGEAALSPVEDVPPPEKAYLVGAIVQLREITGASLRLQYQRDIQASRGVLYGERVAADATVFAGPGTLDARMIRDLATNAFNLVTASYHAAITPSWNVRVDARHYTPYFDLWTIWGAFAPVGYNEGGLMVDWAGAEARTGLSLSGSRRRYDHTDAMLETLPLRTDAWHVAAAARYGMFQSFSVDGTYDIDLGFGASTTDGSMVLRWTPSDRLSLGGRVLAFQNLNEFTIGDGHVLGAGLEGAWAWRPDVRIAGEAIVYRQVGNDRATATDWNQRRASVRVEWTVGAEPGRIMPGGPR